MVASSKEKVVKPLQFHDVELQRGWRVLRQRLDVIAEPEKRWLRGRATLTLAVLDNQTTAISLHLRRCVVTSVTVQGLPAPYEYQDPLADSSFLDEVSTETHRHRVDDVRGKVEAIAPTDTQSELVVSFPPSVSADRNDALDALRAKDGAAAVSAAAEASETPLMPKIERVEQLPTIDVAVEYHLVDQSAGVVFSADPSVMLVDARAGFARSWMPCVDTLNFSDRCPWDITVSVAVDQMAIASGDLLESRIIMDASDEDGHALKAGVSADAIGVAEDMSPAPRRSRRTTDSSVVRSKGDAASSGRHILSYPHKRFTYRVNMPVHAGDIALVVGPFLPLADPSSPLTVTHFCLPGRSRELVHTIPTIFAQARAFCSDYFNADPPISSFKQVFVGKGLVAFDGGDTWFKPRYAAGGLVILPESLLHNPRCIDEGFMARLTITAAVVSSYLGATIRPRRSEDAWFVAGLAAHVTALALTNVLGNNWYRLHIHDQVRKMAEESGKEAPVLVEIAKDPMFGVEMVSPWVRRRAHMIVYLVERRVGFDVFRRALRDTLAETSRALANGNMQDDTVLGLDVGPFVKRLRAICGTDVRNLVKMWAASKGMPRIRFGYKYNARRHQAEFAIEQRAVAHGEKLSRGREGLLFQGSLAVRVMEPEGCVDHAVEVIDPVFVAELSCQCRRTKQKQATQAEKDAGEEPARIVPISWARVDPDLEWCMDVTFIQPEPAWITMLEGERDVLAQVSSCRALGDYGTPTAVASLLDCLENHELYWQVRAEAARALAQCEDGLEKLFSYFRKRYTDRVVVDNAGESGGKRITAEKKEGADAVGVLRGLSANNFSDIGDYLLRRAIIKVIVSVERRNSRGGDTPPPAGVAAFVISLLAENDNSTNMYDEDYYVADLIGAAARVAVRCIRGQEHTSADELLQLVKRYQLLDELTPSRSGAVAAAVTSALADIEIEKLSQSKLSGGMPSAVERMLQCRLEPQPGFMEQILSLCKSSGSLVSRSMAYSALARLYGGDLETVQWILSRADRSSTGEDVLTVFSQSGSSTVCPYIEPHCIRRAALDALVAATETRAWSNDSPIVVALRRHTKRARQVCLRVLRLAVGDSDGLVRQLALRFAENVWGRGVPVCLLDDLEYRDERRAAARRAERAKRQVEVAVVKNQHGGQASTARQTKDVHISPTKTKDKNRGLSSKVGKVNAFSSKPPVLPPEPSLGIGGTKKKKPGGSMPKVVPRSPNIAKSSPKAPSKAAIAKKGKQVSERGSLGVPMSERPSQSGTPVAAPAPSAKPQKDVNLTMTVEDRDFLRKAWSVMRRSATSTRAPSPFRSAVVPTAASAGATGSLRAPAAGGGLPLRSAQAPAARVQAPTSVRVGEKNGVSLGSGVGESTARGAVAGNGSRDDALSPDAVINGSQGNVEDEEERRRRKEERRLKKKRRREGEGREGDKKKKKKKKRRREDGEGGSVGGDGVGESPGPGGEGKRTDRFSEANGAIGSGAGGSSGAGGVPTSEGSVRSDGKLAPLKIKFGGAGPKITMS